MDTYEDDLKKIKRIGNNLFYLPIECYALEKKLRRYSHRARCYHPLITMFHADYFDPLMGYASLSENCSADYLDYLRDINGFQWIDKTLKMSQVNNLRLPVVIKSCETCSKVKGCKIVNSCKSIGNKYCRFFENVL